MNLTKLKNAAKKEKVAINKKKKKRASALKNNIIMTGMVTQFELKKKIGNGKQYDLFLLLQELMFNNRTSFMVSNSWKREAAQKLDTTIATVTKYIHKLRKLDIIKMVEPNMYLINPIVFYFGKVIESFVKTAVLYITTEQYTGDDTTYHYDTWLEDIFSGEFNDDPQFKEAGELFLSGELEFHLDSLNNTK